MSGEHYIVCHQIIQMYPNYPKKDSGLVVKVKSWAVC